MRCAAAFALPVALAAATTVSQVQRTPDQEWSYLVDKTADWYKAHGKPIPEPAPAVTSVKQGQSYIVKLECLGCPFRVRSREYERGSWQWPAPDNSLVRTRYSSQREPPANNLQLLNFTIDGSSTGLLLNGAPIAPYISLPRPIAAFQTPTNLSKEVMGKMVGHSVLDAPWKLGTKYAQFELHYVHTVQATQDPAEEMLQFDVMAIHERSRYPARARLDKEAQKMVQVVLRQDSSDDSQALSIKDVQVIERKDRAPPLRMKCGKLAMIQTEFNPLEWDVYGQFNTWSRAWHVFLAKSANFMLHAGPAILLVLATCFGVRYIIWRVQKRADALVEDDAEAALLASEYEDAPPEYVDGSEDKEEKEDEK